MVARSCCASCEALGALWRLAPYASPPPPPHPHTPQAISIDPTDHVFFSNRSAAYLSKGDAVEALADADKCTELKPSWGKGYGRKGAALFKQGKYDAAVDAYEAGLKVEAGSEALTSGLGEAQAAAQSAAGRRAAAAARAASGGAPGNFPGAFPGGFPGGMGGMGQGPFGPGLTAKLAANPKFIPYLADPAFLAKVKALESDPNATATALGYALGQGFGGGGGHGSRHGCRGRRYACNEGPSHDGGCIVCAWRGP